MPITNKGKRPRVLTSCVADTYAPRGVRIVEFSSASGGGLIQLHEQNGRLHLHVYAQDATVTVTVSKAKR